MKITELKNEGLVREYKVIIESEEIEKKVDDRLKEIGKKLKAPGFRPGKMPTSILRQKHGKQARDEVLRSLVSETSKDVLSKKKIVPAVRPRFDAEEYKKGGDFEYKLHVEVLPEIDEINLKMNLKRYIPVARKSNVEDALKALAAEHGQTKPIKEKRAAKKGDTVVIDFEGSVDGKVIENGTAKDYELLLGSGSFIGNFEDQIVGVKPGDDLEVKVSFPEEYAARDLAGKPAVFKVKLKDILENIPSKIDDSLALKVGHKDAEQLKKSIEARLNNEYAMLAKDFLKQDILDRFSEDHKFEVPETMVEMEFNAICQRLLEGYPQSEHVNVYKENEQEWRSEYFEIAERRVRLGILLAEVAKRKKISVDQNTINQAILRQARNFPGQEKKVVEYYRSNPSALAGIRAPILEERVIDKVLQLSEIKDETLSADEFLDLLRKREEEIEEPKKEEKKTSKKAGEKKKTATGTSKAKEPSKEKAVAKKKPESKTKKS